MQARRRLRYARPMAVTRAIDLQTQVPGPRSREVLDRLADETDVVPSVNQVEIHPYLTQDALRRYDIAYITDGEKHFYRRQEIIDAVNLLRVIDNPHDTIALVGILRSPLGGMTLSSASGSVVETKIGDLAGSPGTSAAPLSPPAMPRQKPPSAQAHGVPWRGSLLYLRRGTFPIWSL